MWPIVGIAPSAGLTTSPENAAPAGAALGGGSESLQSATPGRLGVAAGGESPEAAGGGVEVLTAPAYVRAAPRKREIRFVAYVRNTSSPMTTGVSHARRVAATALQPRSARAASTSVRRSAPAALSRTPLTYLWPSVPPKLLAS